MTMTQWLATQSNNPLRSSLTTLSSAVALSVGLALTGGSAQAEDIPEMTLQMAHNYPPGNIWYDAGEHFTKAVTERTGGKVTFNTAHSASTGTWAEQIEALQIGTNDVVIQSVGTLDRYAPLPGIEAFPYLIRDVDHFKTVFYGPIGEELYAQIEEDTGFKIIGAGYRGARVLSANKKVESLEDLKGLKLRVPPLKMYTRTWELLDASPTPMPFTEVFTSLQQGIIDGQENPYEVIETYRLDEVQDFVMETNHVIGGMTFIFDSARFNSFPPELQTILEEEAEKAMLWATAEMLEKEAGFRQVLKDRGMEIVVLDLTDFRAAIGPLKEEFPELKGWIERISVAE